MAKVVAVCISEKKGTMKFEVPEIQLKRKHGIVGDASTMQNDGSGSTYA